MWKMSKEINWHPYTKYFFSYVYVNFAYVEFTSHNLKDSYTCYD